MGSVLSMGASAPSPLAVFLSFQLVQLQGNAMEMLIEFPVGKSKHIDFLSEIQWEIYRKSSVGFLHR